MFGMSYSTYFSCWWSNGSKPIFFKYLLQILVLEEAFYFATDKCLRCSSKFCCSDRKGSCFLYFDIVSYQVCVCARPYFLGKFSFISTIYHIHPVFQKIFKCEWNFFRIVFDIYSKYHICRMFYSIT